VLGGYDFVNIIEAPTNEVMARIAMELGARGTIKVTTMPAMRGCAVRRHAARQEPRRRLNHRSFEQLTGLTMPNYVMLSRFSSETMRDISADPTSLLALRKALEAREAKVTQRVPHPRRVGSLHDLRSVGQLPRLPRDAESGTDRLRRHEAAAGHRPGAVPTLDQRRGGYGRTT
jgi:uncharacterized protein with GYD domain